MTLVRPMRRERRDDERRPSHEPFGASARRGRATARSADRRAAHVVAVAGIRVHAVARLLAATRAPPVQALVGRAVSAHATRVARGVIVDAARAPVRRAVTVAAARQAAHAIGVTRADREARGRPAGERRALGNCLRRAAAAAVAAERAHVRAITGRCAALDSRLRVRAAPAFVVTDAFALAGARITGVAGARARRDSSTSTTMRGASTRTT